MRTIANIEELKLNLKLFENYLTEGNEIEIRTVNKLIAGGLCFVSYKIGDEWRFAPSRYVGYFNNDLEKHANNINKDGKITNPAINRIAKNKLDENKDLEIKYLEYCYNLGIKPHNKKRKYWLFYFKGDDFENNRNTEEGFPEGKIIERKHKARERNSELIIKAKQNFKEKNGKLFCQICGFDFEKTYGKLGANFIEAHHTIPVSEMKAEYVSKVE